MWRVIINNWPLKLLALGLAVLVWLYANSVVVKKEQVSVYFEVKNPTPTVEASVNPTQVVLHVSGPASVIEQLSGRSLRVVHTVEDVKDLTGDRVDNFRFNQKMVENLPAQVQVDAFVPTTFEVKLRSLKTMKFPANPPKVVGKPAPGYEVGRVEIRGTSSVTVTGPVEVLRRMTSVNPEEVDVTNRDRPFRDERRRIITTVQVDNTTTERIYCNDVVEVNVEIRLANATVVIKEVPVLVLAAPDLAREVEITSENPVNLKLEGSPQALKDLTADRLQAFIDVRKRKPENDLPFFEKLVVHGLPEGVKLSEEVMVTAKFKMPK